MGYSPYSGKELDMTEVTEHARMFSIYLQVICALEKM